MKVYIKEYRRDVTVRIYGIDGQEHTKEFFDRYLYNVEGVDFVSDKEREAYRSEAEYSISKGEYFQYLAENIEKIQQAIDTAAVAIINGKSVSDYCFADSCYLV